MGRTELSIWPNGQHSWTGLNGAQRHDEGWVTLGGGAPRHIRGRSRGNKLRGRVVGGTTEFARPPSATDSCSIHMWEQAAGIVFPSLQRM
jgi:hypothetical protein